MSHTSRRSRAGRSGYRRSWRAGAVGGAVAGIAMGVVLHFALDLMPLIGALVGVETVVAGWVVHLFNSTVFGLLFVAVFDREFFADFRADLGGCAALGTIHSAGLGLLTGGVLLPASMALSGITGFPAPPLPLPGVNAGAEFAVLIAIAHIVYGIVLGGVYGILTGASTGINWRSGSAPES